VNLRTKGIPKLATTTTKKLRVLPKSVETLRQTGFKVRVYHARRYWHRDDFSNETFVSKREAGTQNLDFLGYNLSCHCGYTKVDITTPDGVELSGKYSFGNRQFNRKLGLRAAIGRAFTGRRSRPSI
jgi:hypothetical protein